MDIDWVDELKMKESIEVTNSHRYKRFFENYTVLESEIAKHGQTNPDKCKQLQQSRDHKKLLYESRKKMNEIHLQIFNKHKEFAKERNEFKLRNLSISGDNSFYGRLHLQQWESEFTKSHLQPLYEQRLTLTPVLDWFWETAIFSQKLVADLITDKDDDIILFLIDIECLPDGMGFELKFTFKDNDYFKNKYLTKKYQVSPCIVDKYLVESFQMGMQDKVAVELHVFGTKIDWTSCPFTHRQRKKSFFCNFFDSDFTSGPLMFDTKDGELKGNIPTDYLIGKKFKDKIIPLATYSFVHMKIPDSDQDDYDRERDYACECNGFVECALCRKDGRESDSEEE